MSALPCSLRTTAIGGPLCFSSLLPPFTNHGRHKGLRILISLQTTFKFVLKGEKVLLRPAFQECESGCRQNIRLRHHFVVSHRKYSLGLLQFESPALRALLAALYIRRQLIDGLAAQIRQHGWIGSIAALLIRLQ